MKRWRRHLGRIIVFSFALRALVPMGLMLQLPVANAEDTFRGVHSSTRAADAASLGFVICPLQNPGIDLEVLIDSGQAADQHAHHHHRGITDSHSDDTSSTISIDRSASLCNLWSSSSDNNLLLAEFTGFDFEAAEQLPIRAIVSDHPSKHFPRRLTRAPPNTL